jgi:hypothetical protein
METIEIALPLFPGFYGTLFGDLVEGELDSLLEHELEYQGIVYDDIDVDWLSTYKAVAENVVTGTDALIRDGEFEHTLPDAPCHLTDAVKTFRFIRVEHPREYNFHNDLIIVEAEVCQENLPTSRSSQKSVAVSPPLGIIHKDGKNGSKTAHSV